MVSAAWVATVHRPYLRARLATGRTTRCIAAERLIRIGRRQTGLGAVLAVTLLQDAKAAPGNRSRDRVESSRASLQRSVEQVTLAAARASPTARDRAAWGIAAVAQAWAREEPIASAGGIFREAAQETGVPSEAVPGDSMDRTRGAIAIVAPPA